MSADRSYVDLREQRGFWNEGRTRDLAMSRMGSEMLSLDGRLRATLMRGHLAASPAHAGPFRFQ